MAEVQFSPGHVWARVDGDVAVLGLTDYLQDQLGEIIGLDLPDLGDFLRAQGVMAGVQSEVAKTRVPSPLTGEVVDVNQEVLSTPDVVNQDPYDGGWLLRLRMEDPSELEELMSEEEYMELTTEV